MHAWEGAGPHLWSISLMALGMRSSLVLLCTMCRGFVLGPAVGRPRSRALWSTMGPEKRESSSSAGPPPGASPGRKMGPVPFPAPLDDDEVEAVSWRRSVTSADFDDALVYRLFRRQFEILLPGFAPVCAPAARG